MPRLFTSLFQLFRFGIVGVLATIVHMAAFVIGIEQLAFNENLANFLAFFPAFVVSYVGHAKFSFRDESTSLLDFKQAGKFLFATGLGFASNLLIVFVSVTLMDVHHRISVILMICITPVLVFLTMKFFVYNTARSAA